MSKNVKGTHSKERANMWNQGDNNFNSISNLFSNKQVLKSLLGYKLQVVIGNK